MATTFRNEKLFCLNCGSEFALNFPIPLNEMNDKIKAFDMLHKDCKPTWREPKVDPDLHIQQKAMWWLANGEIGMSSKTMWHCFMGTNEFPIHHPYDPDDFSRCYKLLETVPEWKKELHKLALLSQEWSNLIDNWDKLTEMYEQNVKEQWKNHKKIGMYEFMKKLIQRDF